MSNLIDFTKRFGESLSQKVKLSNYSWFNLGGNAEFFFKPKDKTELLEFFKEAKKNEEVIEDKGVKVFIDSNAIMYLLGTEMDYKTDKFSSQFVFKNPNETERCGCGESFKV